MLLSSETLHLDLSCLWMHHWFIPSVCFAAVFLFVANVYAYLDVTQPEWYQRRSVTEHKRVTLDRDRWMSLNAYAIRNIFLAWVVGMLVFSIASQLDWVPHTGAIPVSFAQLTFCYLIGSEYFGWAHWIVHRRKWLNDAVHHHHHQYAYPVALVGLYASVAEMMVLNIPLAVLPPLLMRADTILAACYTSLLAFYVATNHCGHQLIPKLAIDVSFHDLHHQIASKHYGSYWLP